MQKTAILPIIIIVILAATLSAIGIWRHDVSEWDEARNGVNAYEMYHNGDYINLYYDNEIDTWNAKPPLLSWLIVICYHLFGFNEFALRFPSFISTILFFVYLYKLIVLFDNRINAFIACFILLTCKAVIGGHVGISGDFDAPLLLSLTATIYYMLRYLEFYKGKDVCMAAIFWGLAFYFKGFAAFIILPGILLYLLLAGKLWYVIQKRKTWIGVFILIFIVASWVAIVLIWAKKPAENHYHNKNAIETMLVNDIYERFTSPQFDYKDNFQPDHFFFVSTIDAKYNLWNYLFFTGIAIGLFSLFRHRSSFIAYIREDKRKLALLSISLILPIALLLTIATYKHFWYLAPMYGFIAYITAGTVVYLGKHWYPSAILIGLLMIFTFARHTYHLYQLPSGFDRLMDPGNKYFKDHDEIIISGHIAQHALLYVKWLNKKVIKATKIPESKKYIGLPVIHERYLLQENKDLISVAEHENYIISIIHAK